DVHAGHEGPVGPLAWSEARALAEEKVGEASLREGPAQPAHGLPAPALHHVVAVAIQVDGRGTGVPEELLDLAGNGLGHGLSLARARWCPAQPVAQWSDAKEAPANRRSVSARRATTRTSSPAISMAARE